jgi:hypothetical protein
MREYYPMGLLIDIGLGPALWDDLIDCYGNGVCLGLEGSFQCQCTRGFYGDCLSRSCPLGRAWFHEPAVDEVAHDVMMECSNMGICDRGNGQCTCRKGYEGAACERMSCPGRISTSSDCNGRGRCISMRNLALQHRDAFQSPDPVEYGSKAADPATWDADMVYGCFPDQYGYVDAEYKITTPSGAALTKYECPVGYNTRLLDRVVRTGAGDLLANYTMVREKQSIRCDALSGYFTVSFRGATSAPIYANASSLEVVQALQSLQTLGKVEVRYDPGMTELCTQRAHVLAYVTFVDQLGLVPMMAVAENYLDGGAAMAFFDTEHIGTTDGLLECAGKGDCDFTTGLCRCWDRQGTSDGIGGPGDSGDCGNYLI